MFSFEVGSLLNIGLVLVVGLVVSIMMIWVERRFLGFFSDRLGPNRVGPFGIFQVIADALKMLTKEDWIPPFSISLPLSLRR